MTTLAQGPQLPDRPDGRWVRSRVSRGGGRLGPARTSRRAWLRQLAGGVLVAGWAARGASAAERDQKVRYLLSFTEYVQWPERAFSSSQAPIRIGILGEDPFGETLDQQAAEFRGRRRIEVLRFKGMQEFQGGGLPGPWRNPQADRQKKKDEALRRCHVLYVSRSEDDFVPQILGKVRGWSVLTVGESKSFAQTASSRGGRQGQTSGGVIGLYQLPGDPQVRFEINLAHADEAKLKISPQLLALAKVIRD